MGVGKGWWGDGRRAGAFGWSNGEVVVGDDVVGDDVVDDDDDDGAVGQEMGRELVVGSNRDQNRSYSSSLCKSFSLYATCVIER